MEKGCKLVFELDKDGNANIEIDGTQANILFCLIGLTAQVCEQLDIPTNAYVAKLPEMISVQRHCLKQKVKIDKSTIIKQTGGGRT